MFARHLIERARITGPDVELGIRLNRQRSLPLSCVERLEVSVDGHRLEADGPAFELGGASVPAAELTGQDGRWWHVLDGATVRGVLDAPPVQGEHGAALLIATRIPYQVGPDGNAVVITDRARAVIR